MPYNLAVSVDDDLLVSRLKATAAVQGRSKEGNTAGT
jgi:hypothetical protein